MTLALHYDFATDKSLVAAVGPTLTITRTTDATYIDSSGVMQTASSGVARFGHDPLTPYASKGLLVEEERTNFADYSKTMSTGSWSALSGGTNFTNGTTASPDGTTNASTLEDNSGGGTNTVGIRHILGTGDVAASTAHAYSIYAKADGIDWIRLQVTNIAPINPECWFDVANGTVGTPSGDVDAAGIEELDNGWYRCWLTFTNSLDTTGRCAVWLAEADSGTSVTLDGTSSAFIWGVQFERGTFPTSLITTTIIPVTRNSDYVWSSDVTWLNQSQGSVYVRANLDYPSSANLQMLFEANDNSVSDRVGISSGATDGSLDVSTKSTVGDNGTINGVIDFVAGVDSDVGFGYADDDLVTYLDGSANGTSSSATFPTSQALTHINIGSRLNAFHVNGHIAEVRYYDERFLDTAIEDLSNGTFPATAVLAGIKYPRDAMPTDEARFHTFITDSGIVATGDLARDYRAALATLVGVSDTGHSMNDLFKRYYESL